MLLVLAAQIASVLGSQVGAGIHPERARQISNVVCVNFQDAGMGMG